MAIIVKPIVTSNKNFIITSILRYEKNEMIFRGENNVFCLSARAANVLAAKLIKQASDQTEFNQTVKYIFHLCVYTWKS